MSPRPLPPTAGQDRAPGIEVVDLVRAYRGTESRNALDGITFTVERGTTTALLGPNGAGKTTLARILSTLLTPSSGTARVAGFDVGREPAQVRSAIGLVLGGERGLYSRLTARQNVRYWAAMCGLTRRQAKQGTDGVLERLGLSEHADRPVERFSRGMLQRVHLARALVGQPQVLVLDEPTSGMDPNAAAGFLELVRDLQAQGVSILLTTHDMHEAQQLSRQVVLLDQGRIAAQGTPADLLAGSAERQAVSAARTTAHTLPALEAAWGAELLAARLRPAPDGALRLVVDTTSALAGTLALLAGTGCSGIQVTAPDLGDVYRSVIPDREFAVL